MSESADYTPAAHWGGHDFVSARRAYRDHVDASLTEAKRKNINPMSCVPKSISTNCESPVVIACDVTGSFGEWPATIFSKMPYLEYEAQEYLGDDCKFSFCAVGDAGCSPPDKYPLQVQKFVKGSGIKDKMEALIHERGGGGNEEESYDLAALYYARNCTMDGAIRKPIFIWICDEGIYDSPRRAEWTYTDGGDGWKAAFDELKQKFSVYAIRKMYGGGSTEKRIMNQWTDTLGKDRVVMLQDPGRVVDVIFGLLANETGRIEYFEDELRDRQGKDDDGDEKIAKVLKSLHSVHKVGKAASLKKIEGPKGGGKSKSKMKSGPKGSRSKSKSLLDD